MLDLVFMGTPAFAATVLGALLGVGHRILAVYAQPPRPAGRGRRLQPSPVQLLAEQSGLVLRCPTTLRGDEAQAEFAALGAAAAVVAAYGLILPRPMLTAPRFGCLNVHASLLPRWRGAAPIQRALLAGDAETGITIMQMDEGLDTGPILLQEALPIGRDGREPGAAALSATLAAVGGRLIVAALGGVAEGRLTPRPQPPHGVTYAAKLRRTEGRLDWRLPAVDLERRVRAFDPWPGAFFEHGGERIRVLSAAVLPDTGTSGGGSPESSPPPPGTVLDERLSIACGAGAMRPLRLQRAGRAVLDGAAFLRGFPIAKGTMLACPATG